MLVSMLPAWERLLQSNLRFLVYSGGLPLPDLHRVWPRCSTASCATVLMHVPRTPHRALFACLQLPGQRHGVSAQFQALQRPPRSEQGLPVQGTRTRSSRTWARASGSTSWACTCGSPCIPGRPGPLPQVGRFAAQHSLAH